MEASIERVRLSIFDDNGKADSDFNKFKSTLNKIIKQEFFSSRNFVAHVLSYTINKYNKQFVKLKKYIDRVKQGDDIWFRELYYQQKNHK